MTSTVPTAASAAADWPIDLDAVRAAEARLRPYLPPTPLRRYGTLDRAVGNGIRVLVKHENHQPTNSFKVRNGLSLMTALPEAQRRRGVVAATRGNHGLGLAYAGTLLDIPVTVCVPVGNNPDKNDAMRALGARVIEEGRDYDEAVVVAARIAERDGLPIAHSTNDRSVIAGAATIALEMIEQAPELEALVIGVGGGSQAVGALTVTRALAPDVAVYAVQAAGAPAAHDSWHAGSERPTESATTFADGLATRGVYAMTFPALRTGLAGFVTVSDAELAAALRLLLSTTHTLVEGAGAAGLAGIGRLTGELRDRQVGIILSGGNIDLATLRRVVSGEL